MRRMLLLPMAAAVAIGLVAVSTQAHEKGKEPNLPPGPIKDRHVLMESIGGHADRLGKALKKSNQLATVATEADAIGQAAVKITALFPEGSTHPESRAKAEIWTRWIEFETISKGLAEDAAALAKVAREKGDAGAASKKMFGRCKACHDAFRVPEKK